MKDKQVLFLTLYTFNLTGGIEKVCQVLMDVFEDLKTKKYIKKHLALSLYDKELETLNYSGFNGNKVKFALSTFQQALKADIIILSHINLLVFANIIKKIQPKKEIVLLAHGIEVWKPLANWKKKMLKGINIWAVSNYTSQQLQLINDVPKQQITVLNNSLPKGFVFEQKTKSFWVHDKYHIQPEHKILLTTCRLSSEEKYKGYDLVLLALKDLIKVNPNITYLIVGKADEDEKQRIQNLIASCGLSAHVMLTGYVSDEELTQFYRSTDIFVMPSKGEGFGLVFIEAAAYGCEVIAGNVDGSRDALLNGDLGLLVDPHDSNAIYEAIQQLLTTETDEQMMTERHNKILANFGFDQYKVKVANLINNYAS